MRNRHRRSRICPNPHTFENAAVAASDSVTRLFMPLLTPVSQKVPVVWNRGEQLRPQGPEPRWAGSLRLHCEIGGLTHHAHRAVCRGHRRARLQDVGTGLERAWKVQRPPDRHHAVLSGGHVRRRR